MDVLTALHGIMHMDMYLTMVQVSSVTLMILTMFTLMMFHESESVDVSRDQFKIEILCEPSEELSTLRSIKNVYHSYLNAFPKGTPMYKNSFVEYMNACKEYKRYSLAMCIN